jgi:hypothetical protein
MSVVKNTLQENYIYFIRELARVEAIDTQRVTAEEIIKIFSQHGIKSVLIAFLQ